MPDVVSDRPGLLHTLARPLLVGAVLALLVASIALALWVLRPRLTEEQVQTAVISTLAQEAPASFLVTGRLSYGVTSAVSSTRTLLPGVLDFSLGTSRAEVRVPAVASYGFDVRALTPANVRLEGDGVVEVDLPPLAVFSVEPEVEHADIQTERGWARMDRGTDRRLIELALRDIRPTMREQAERHLQESDAPALNTAQALARMLTPPLEAAGLPAPRFRFRLGGGAVLELDGPPEEPPG